MKQGSDVPLNSLMLSRDHPGHAPALSMVASEIQQLNLQLSPKTSCHQHK